MKNTNMNMLNDQEMEKVAGGMITEDEAMASALEHAGLKKDQIEFMKKMGLDYEHGRKVFEYEFDIDAETGKVLKYKKDWD